MKARRVPLFVCRECGRRFHSVAAAERASFGDRGCHGCGGSDIDTPDAEPRPAPKRAIGVFAIVTWKQATEDAFVAREAARKQANP